MVQTAGQRTTTLRCSHPGCRTPVLVVEGDSVLAGTRHHGERHENRIGLVEILENAIQVGLSPVVRCQLQEMLSHE